MNSQKYLQSNRQAVQMVKIFAQEFRRPL